MITTQCPDRETLLAYSVGRLADQQSDQVANHLSSCPDCQAAIQTLDDAGDTLLSRLRTAVDDPCLEEPQLNHAVAKVLGRAGESEPPSAGESRMAGPRLLGEYRLLEELGRGGMGRVYLALHTKLDRVVALKILPKSRLEEPQAMARFEREMRAIGQLKHPNIVHAYDAREIDGQPVLIMEYIDGFDLAELVRRLGKLGIADACELVRQAAAGLQCAHEHGLVHRDVKPSNLMLSREGELKLLDLGLARLYARGLTKGDRSILPERPSGCFAQNGPVPFSEMTFSEMTDTGQAMGTADYMAPEQANDSRGVDIRADLYSLGCTLYKLLAGRAPFGDPEHRGTFEKMTAHVRESIPPIRQHAPDVPDGVCAILDRLLAKEPEGRFATPAEVARALAPFCAGADLAGLAARAAEASGAVNEQEGEVAGGGLGPEVAARSMHPAARRWRPWAVLTAIGLVLLGTAGSFLLGVVITIKRAAETRLEVADGSKVQVDGAGNVEVTPPGESGAGDVTASETEQVLSDEGAIQGVWVIVSSQYAGENRHLASKDTLGRLTFTNGRFTEVIAKEGRIVKRWEGSYQLDTRRHPKAIDLNLKDEGLKPGIYRFEGDQLRIVWNESTPEAGRPTKFVSEPSSRNEVLMILRRVAEAELSLENPATSTPPAVEVRQPLVREISDYADYPGRVEATYPAIPAGVDGTVGKVHFKDGATVKQGDLLFEIEVSPTSQQKSPLAKITAHASGQITQLAGVGKKVRANEVVARFALFDPMCVSFPVDERTVLQIRRMIRTDKSWVDRETSLPVLCGLPDEEGFPHRGKVEAAGDQFDPATATTKWVAAIPNPEGMLMPGMFARVRLIMSAPYKALMVPADAVATDDQGRTSVFVLTSGNVVERRPVKARPRDDGLWAVTEGLTADDRVVVSAADKLKPGMIVKPQSPVSEVKTLVDAASQPAAGLPQEPPHPSDAIEPGPNSLVVYEMRHNDAQTAAELLNKILEGTGAKVVPQGSRGLIIYAAKSDHGRIKAFLDTLEKQKAAGQERSNDAPPPDSANTPAAPASDSSLLSGIWEVGAVEGGERADWKFPARGHPNELAPQDVDRVAVDIPATMSLMNSKTGKTAYCRVFLDPTKSPKELDLVRAQEGGTGTERVALGIYHLEGDRLTICLARFRPDGGKDQRPKDLAVEPGSGKVCFHLHRSRSSQDIRAISNVSWHLEKKVVDGHEATQKEIDGTRFHFSQSKFFVERGDLGNPFAPFEMDGIYVLDGAVTPKAITLVPHSPGGQGKLFGIYAVEGDQLRIAYRENGPRPTKFESELGSGVTLLVFSRKGRAEDSQKPATPSTKQTAVNVHQDGSITLDQKTVTLEQLTQKLAAARAEHPGRLAVMLRIDKGVTTQRLAEIMDACKQAEVDVTVSVSEGREGE